MGEVIEVLPDNVVERLFAYYRYINSLDEKGVLTVSSRQIADNTGLSPVRVRKDFSYIGKLGVTGVGYDVLMLKKRLKKILNLNKKHPVVVIGEGTFVTALWLYWKSYMQHFEIKAICDKNPRKAGETVDGIVISDVRFLPEVVKKHQIELGIIANPSFSAQEAVDMLVKVGIKAIFNLSPEPVKVPSDVRIRNLDMASYLKVLTFKSVENK